MTSFFQIGHFCIFKVNEMEELIAQLIPSASDDEEDDGGNGDDDRTKEE